MQELEIASFFTAKITAKIVKNIYCGRLAQTSSVNHLNNVW